jgi:hypothetical protein
MKRVWWRREGSWQLWALAVWVVFLLLVVVP